ncbi:MAG: glutamate racemase, partial [Spirochaetota bacterium]
MSTIAFLDSGIGGIPYFARTRELLPDFRYVYLADTAHFPYGEQGADEVRQIVHGAVASLVDRFDPAVIAIACNTASVVALDSLRERFHVPFVGVVPAIRPAAKLVANGTIGVLATERTVEDPYVSRLIRDFAPDSRVVLVAAGGLVELVEREWPPSLANYGASALAEPFAKLQAEGAEAVVLGCTHFVHLKDELAELLGPGVTLVDSVEGVCNQIRRIAGQPDRSTPESRDILAISGGRVSEAYIALA